MFKVAVGAEEQVSRLDVAVNHAFAVQKFQSEARLDENLPNCFLFQTLALGLVPLDEVV